MDFSHLFPMKDQYLLQKFVVFKNKLKTYFKGQSNLNVFEQNIIKKIISPAKLGDDDLAIIQILSYLFKPVNIKIPKKTANEDNQKTIKYCMLKPSKLEQASAVIVNIKNSNDIKTTHEQKVNRAFINNLTVQPYIAIVGNIEDASSVLNYYTVIDKIETPIKALDICFKSFHALNLNYPPEAEQVRWFIQDYFF
ncbi:uncharacterized protein LOC112690652 [Sipha flava]|uniref:Uncharacterized protein LOC112690652 n=1 Tax=Sipha flava TaxID=143950 RepID=A0A8B8GCF4_9HEMI|nr:uncharacterized protein LOC112690652 [Sipha flava]